MASNQSGDYKEKECAIESPPIITFEPGKVSAIITFEKEMDNMQKKIMTETAEKISNATADVNNKVDDLSKKVDNRFLFITNLFNKKINAQRRNMINFQRRQSINNAHMFKLIKILVVCISFMFITIASMSIMSYMSITKYNNIISLLTTTINENQEKIENLEKSIEDLENELQNFEKKVSIQNNAPIQNSSVVETPVSYSKTSAVEENKIINTTDITQPSNLNADQLNQIINLRLNAIGVSSSKLENLGQALYDMEQKYEVNALFCLSVGSLESGHGTSSAARNRNNLFGLISSNGLMKFESPDKCVDYWGKLIRNSYINKGYNSISSIQKKYCPGSSLWISSIQSFMNIYGELVSQIE